MFKVGFFLQDDTLPRTEYWERFLQAAKASEAFGAAACDLLVPHEDMAVETNWPRYGDPDGAYIRGSAHDFSEGGASHRYFNRIVDAAEAEPDRKFLYLNMRPFFRVPAMLRQRSNILVADISLPLFERSLNPGTISMPALPIIAAPSARPGARAILASFQGANSHPVRQSLKRISDGTSIVVNIVGRGRHAGKVDAIALKGDADYERLLASSTFAFVPRGDALFSYRLLEAMSFGCIPVIFSDGWVLPFDRTVRWDEFALHVHADAIPRIPEILSSLTPGEILARQEKTLAVYRSCFSSLEKVVAALFGEAEGLCRPRVAS